MNITFDPNEYEVGTFGTGQISEDFYKYRPINDLLVFYSSSFLYNIIIF